MCQFQSHGWDGFLFSSKQCVDELDFWCLELVNLNGFPLSLSRSEVTIVSDVNVVSDASSNGNDSVDDTFVHLYYFSGIMVYKGGSDSEVLARKLLYFKVTKEFSTYRDLKALHAVYTLPLP